MKRVQFLVFLLIASVFSTLSAQVELQEKQIPVDVAIELKNAHIWRGLDVTHNLLIDANARLMDKSKTFAFGIWGATTFTSDFREFDYYVGFYKNGFSAEIWDVFNFSTKNQYDAISNPSGYNTEKAFDYSAHGTGHFIDLRLGYTFQKFPLHVAWNTVLFGRDRAWRPGKTNDWNDREVSNSRYSTYVEADYPILKGSIVDVKLGVAAVFTLRDAKINGEKIKGTFYGESQGFANANITFTKRLKLGEHYTLPVSVMGVWNAEANKTYLEIAVSAIQF